MLKNALRSSFPWILFSVLTATIEILVSALVSSPLRQHLRDLPLSWVYRDMLTLVLLYGGVGGLGGVAAGFVLLWWKKGKEFFSTNPLTLCVTLIVSIYGYWALRKFLFLRGVMTVLGLLAATAGLVVFAAVLGWNLQHTLSSGLKRKWGTTLIVATFLLPVLFRFPQWELSEVPSLPNLIVLSVDTLRPDHLGVLGYSKAKTPHIDRLASSGLTFRQAYAQIPLTGPSFASILTGLYPKNHGCRENLTVLSPSFTTLSELLRGSHYQTAAFVSGYPLKREFCGLAQGFTLYQDRFSFFDGFKLPRFLERLRLVELQFERRAEHVSSLSIPWLRRHARHPFFVWIHYYDPHVPYRPPLPPQADSLLQKLRLKQRHVWGKKKAELPEATLQAMKTLYDGEIAYVDQDIGRTLSFLERSGLREKTLVLFVSDHGEGFDHDYYFDHGDRLYESCIRIPVIFSYPGVIPENGISGEMIQSVDLFPTLLSMLKLPERESEGRNLFGKGKFLFDDTSYPVYAELSRRPGYPTLGDLWSLREGPWKLIYAPEGRSLELYNLSEDPQETTNLSFKESEKAEGMKKRLIQWMGEKKEKTSVRRSVEGLAREKLKSLGYLQ